MAEIIPEDIKEDKDAACGIHGRAVLDYEQCTAFSALMSDVLSRLEDVKCWDTADRVMGILLDCNPKTGAHCDKAILVGQAVDKLLQKIS